MDDIGVFIYGIVLGAVFVGGLVFLLRTLRKRHRRPLPSSPPFPTSSSFSRNPALDKPEMVFVHADLRVARTPQQYEAWDKLSGRKKQVAVLVASGKSNPEVAAELHLQKSTVEGYLKEIYNTLDVRSRTELANFVRDIALDKPPPLRDRDP